MAEALPVVVSMLESQDYSDDLQVCSLVEAALARFGDSVEAIVLYGSFTRGQTDTLLDLYILLKDLEPLPAWQRVLGTLLAPNVYQLVTPESRAKVAVMTFDALEKGVRGDIAPYFWARFAQPCSLVYGANNSANNSANKGNSPDASDRFARLVSAAAERLVAAAASDADAGLDSRQFWVHTFGLTYSAELRSERSSRYLALYEANAPYFDAIYQTFAGQNHPPQTSWRLRRLAGKLLSVLRIAKSAFTFDDPVDYALWKVQRHSGVTVTATERQRRYPLLFAWPLVWRLYRQGALK
jgi:hypothetical protein